MGVHQITSRRGALGVLAASPLAVLPALAATQCSARAEASAHSPKIARLIAEYEKRDRAFNQFVDKEQGPALEAYERAVEAIPHHRTQNGFRNFEGGVTHLTTEDPASVVTARRAIAGEILAKDSADADYWDTLNELIEADNERRRQITALDDRFGIYDLSDREDDLCQAVCEAASAVMFAPVATIQDLAAKVDFMIKSSGWGNGDYQDRIVADIHALAGRA